MEYENNRDKDIDMSSNKKKKENGSKYKSGAFVRGLNDKVDKLADMMPDFLVGRKEVMYEKYISVYGAARSKQMIAEARRRTGKMYLLLFTVVLIIIASFIFNMLQSPQSLLDLKRNPYAGNNKTISVEVDADYKGKKQTKSADITVRPKSLTEKERMKRIEVTKKRLPGLILKNNVSLNSVVADLDLIVTDPQTGVDISWSSNNEEILSEDGHVNPLVASDSKPVILNAQLGIDETLDNLKLTVKFSDPRSEKELNNAINASIDNTIQKMNESDEGDEMILPNKTAEGVKLTWKTGDSRGILTQILLIVFVGICIYYNRYRFLNRHIQETKDSVTRDFPDFINKLVLLLNAGMVVTAAFEKITDDYKSRSKLMHKKYLYEEFCKMEENIKLTNSSFLVELNDIAQRSGIRDVMRFNTIIVDNIDKGSALVDKLQSESNILWTGRIKMAEEKGKLAETKLTFPMVLQLLVLIIITIAPAAMEM